MGSLTTHQLWTIALDAIMTERVGGGGNHTTLYPAKQISPEHAKQTLKESWDITRLEELDGILGWLAAEGQRMEQAEIIGHPPLSWDLCRFVNIVRFGLEAGFFDEAGAWQRLVPVPPAAAQTYGSWRDYADDYLAGRQLWQTSMKGTEYEGWGYTQDETVQAVRRLLDPANAESPWQRVPWEAIYRPDSAA